MDLDISQALSQPPLPLPKRRRTRTEVAEKAIVDCLDGENVDKLLSYLTEDERNMFYDLLAQLREHGELNLDDLWKIDYTRRPPTMEEFISDPYWIGDVCNKSEESQGIFTEWKRVMCNDFNLDSRIHNVVITGSMGIGKSFSAALIMCYRIVLGKLLRNPHAFLGLSKGSNILYVMLSVTKTAVSETIFGDAQNFMGNSPFFKEECGFDPQKKYGNFTIPLGGAFHLTAGSRGQHIIGRNTLGVAMDEGNWRLERNPDQSAYKLFDEVRTRLKNRFQKLSGYLPAISILASSSKDESSFTEQAIADINSVNDPATQRVYRYSVYKIKRDQLKFSDRWFRVAYGLKNFEPRILSGFVYEDGNPWCDATGVKSELEEPPPGAKVEIVPDDYLESFQRNVTTNLQSICGVSTGASYRLFANTFDLERAIESATAAGLNNPCAEAQFQLSDENDREIHHHLSHPMFLTRQSGRVVPLRDPHAPRYAHFDLATATQAGVAICHVVGNQVVEKVYNKMTGTVFNDHRIVVEYDLILAITAGDAKPISIRKIQNLFFWLRKYCGFSFAKITGDSYQSALVLQDLINGGFEAELLSLDKTKIPYYAWRDAFQEGRIRWFRHHMAMHEAEQLLDLPEKIDHNQTGSKDVTDACAGAYYNAFMHGQNANSALRTGDGGLSGGSQQDLDTAPLVNVNPAVTPLPPQVPTIEV